MNEESKAHAKEMNAHFMAVLDGAIREARLNYVDVDPLIGVSPGMTGRWMRNEQTMRGPMFVSIALAVGADPEELMSRAMKRMKNAGLLDRVAVHSETE